MMPTEKISRPVDFRRLETPFDNLNLSNLHIQKRLEEVHEEIHGGLRTAETSPKTATRAKRLRPSGAD